MKIENKISAWANLYKEIGKWVELCERLRRYGIVLKFGELGAYVPCPSLVPVSGQAYNEEDPPIRSAAELRAYIFGLEDGAHLDDKMKSVIMHFCENEWVNGGRK